MAKYVLGVDLGGTNFRLAAIDGKGNILARLKRSTEVEKGREKVLASLTGALNEVIQQCRKKAAKCMAIGLGVPGAIDLKKGVVTQSPNIPELDGFNIRNYIQRKMNFPVALDNDANVAALGERWVGAGKGVNNLVMLTLGTGVGGGIILDGEVWHGVEGMAGELGHITVWPNGPRCQCGNHGCIETYSSATGIVRMATRALKSGKRTSMRKMCNGNPKNLTGKMVTVAAKGGDKVALDVLHEAGRCLGIVIADLINVLNVELVVVGGGVTAGWTCFADVVRSEVKRRAFRIPAERARIVRARCGDNAGLYGAAYLAWQEARKN